jgi:hypothetical protein
MAFRAGRLLLSMAVVTCITSLNSYAIDPPASPPQSSARIQGWTDQERHDWYQTPVGTWLIPYDWFMALDDEPLKNSFSRTGILPDDTSPDRLPLGMPRTEGPYLPAPVPFLGLNCAFCHTTEISYRGTTHRIEGGPSLQFNTRFLKSLLETLGDNITPQKFVPFASKVLQRRKQPVTPETLDEFKKEVASILPPLIERGGRDISPEAWGPGRFDALGRGMNTVFAALSPDNLRPANAPVSIPALWGAWEYDWVQWSGSIQHPLARNIAQVIGVNASLFAWTKNGSDQTAPDGDVYRSSLDTDSLKKVEHLARHLLPPRWPSSFPPIDRALAARGRDLYHGVPFGEPDAAKRTVPNLCAHCHVGRQIEPRPASGPIRALTMVPQKEVGTDSLYLENFSQRKIDLSRIGLRLMPAKDAIKTVTDELLKRHQIDKDPEYQGLTNTWRDDANYIARPHLAIWATAPYLHNGSVPNLWELLSPAEERHTCFQLRPNMEFDPQRVGYVVLECTENLMFRDPLGGFDFKTRLPGNGNGGHEFKGRKEQDGCEADSKKPGVLGCAIPEPDRRAIIEYLKTCDLERFVLKEPPPCDDLN